MIEPTNSDTFSNDSLFEDGEIFFRPSDRERRDSVCAAIAKGGMSIAISATNGATLAHYGKLILNRLRAMPNLEVEVYTPSDTAGVLDRFNQMLGDLSMQEAMGQRSAGEPIRILMLNHDESITAAESQLLTRLVNNFPGANTQLVVMQIEYPSDESTRQEASSQRLMRWRIQLPSTREANDLLTQARSAGMDHEVLALLNKTMPRTFDPLATPQPPLDLDVFEDEPIHATETAAESLAITPPPKSPFKGILKVTLTLLVMMTIAATIVLLAFPRHLATIRAFIQPQSSEAPPRADTEVATDSATKPVAENAEINSPEKTASDAAFTEKSSQILEGTSPIPARTNDAIGPAVTASGALENTITPNPGGKNVIQVLPNKADSTTANNVANITSNTNTNTNNTNTNSTTTAPATGTNTTNSAASTPTPAKGAVAERPAAVEKAATTPTPEAGNVVNISRTELNTIIEAPRTRLVVQHIAADTYAEATNWRKTHPILVKSLIVAVRPKGQNKIKYAVVSGPFKTKAEAEAFTAQKGVPPDTWIRSTGSLQDAIDKELSSKARD